MPPEGDHCVVGCHLPVTFTCSGCCWHCVLGCNLPITFTCCGYCCHYELGCHLPVIFTCRGCCCHCVLCCHLPVIFTYRGCYCRYHTVSPLSCSLLSTCVSCIDIYSTEVNRYKPTQNIRFTTCYNYTEYSNCHWWLPSHTKCPG